MAVKIDGPIGAWMVRFALAAEQAEKRKEEAEPESDEDRVADYVERVVREASRKKRLSGHSLMDLPQA